MILLLDIGNSRLKWALVDAGHIKTSVSMDYRQADFLDKLHALWRSIDRPKQLAIATVAGHSISSSLIDLALALWPGLEVIVPQASAAAFGVKNAYLQPEKLGIDRWLAMQGAYRSYAGANCVVDCGTAITIDFIDTDGQHLGGLISPGLWLMKKALAQNTAALPFSEHRPDASLAVMTEAAINSGVLLAAVGMVEAALLRQPKAYRLLLTGGDAELVASQLSIPNVIDGGLIFKGLLNYCQTEKAI